MDLEEALVEIRKLIDQELSGFFKSKIKEAECLNPKTVDLVDEIAAFTLRGGKRTRAFLVWLGYVSVIPAKAGIQYSSGIPRQARDDKLMSVMLAIELFQSFALIHDDIIDEDTERRGGPTVHEYFKSQISSNDQTDTNKSKHFGESMAILAGDLAFSWATELIEQTKSTTQKLFNRMVSETILGQSLDVLRLQTGANIDKAKIDKLKTAYYSVVRPLELGAVLARAEPKLLNLLEKYGLAVGLTYQLRDNLLDREITDDIFETEKTKYLTKIDPLVSQIKTYPEIAMLFREFASFVVNRNA